MAPQAPNSPMSPIHRTETFTHTGFRVPDPFAPRRRPGSSFVHAVLATALFRCWHILVFFGAWATAVTVVNHNGYTLRLEPTLLTVLGTVLGFVVSYRTTASFERYNEGRRLWSQIMLANRTFARLVWFHVPNTTPETPPSEEEEAKARSLVEKKSVINLLEAFAVAVKHYLRGEDGIYYQDLYYLVKHLPAYALPAGLPSQTDLISIECEPTTTARDSRMTGFPGGDEEKGAAHLGLAQSPSSETHRSTLHQRPISGPYGRNGAASGSQHIKLPDISTTHAHAASNRSPGGFFAMPSIGSRTNVNEKRNIQSAEEAYLFPASMPPKYTIFDLFPFSLLIKIFAKRGHEVKGKKAARIRAKMMQKTVSHNLPLEISLYLSSYIACLQSRKTCDVPTTNALLAALLQLGDSLSGLERILTTPVPFSYSIHLWVVTILYCLALPLQVWKPLQWMTIPASTIVTFMFFGFLVAGEEIENPFGYDKNDLNLDHFTANIIRSELKAVTSSPPPDVGKWAFAPENNCLSGDNTGDRFTPEEWVERGHRSIQAHLSRV